MLGASPFIFLPPRFNVLHFYPSYTPGGAPRRTECKLKIGRTENLAAMLNNLDYTQGSGQNPASGENF
jgi:hypothetical protein